MVHDLRPAQLDDLGLIAALGYLVDEARQNNLLVTLDIEGNRQRLDPLVETVLFRIAQEVLTNVKRHANASQARMTLSFGAQEIRLAVRDEGVGFDPDEIPRPPHGWGLAGMRERAESVGGRFKIDSAPGHGTQVEVAVPILHGKAPGDANKPASRNDTKMLQKLGQPESEENSDEYNSANAG
jgi:two-component system NarL family sensor kinase